MATSSPNKTYSNLPIPLGLRQLKRIEELRDGKDPSFQIDLTGLIAVQTGQFERLQNTSLSVTVPRSHWIDHVAARRA